MSFETVSHAEEEHVAVDDGKTTKLSFAKQGTTEGGERMNGF
jgi:hypothetical protein